MFSTSHRIKRFFHKTTRICSRFLHNEIKCKIFGNLTDQSDQSVLFQEKKTINVLFQEKKTINTKPFTKFGEVYNSLRFKILT